MGGEAPSPGPQADRAARERLTELYGRHGEDILAYALRRAQTPEDAADALAETFLVAWRRLAEVPSEPEARLWLYGVARRTLLNQRRGALRRERLAERMRAEARAILPVAPREGRGDAVLAALGALREQERELLLLIAWEELSPAQAARVLGISAVAGRARLHRARRRLRGALAAQGLDAPHHTPQARMEEAR